MAPALRIGLGVLLAGFLSCSSEERRRVVSAPPVATVPVLVIDLEDRIEASGELIARQHAQIASEVSGRITQIVLDEGSATEAGATVLEIDPERRQLELMTTRAGLVEARTTLVDQRRDTERVRELHRRNVASESELGQAETKLQLADSRVSAARARAGVAERALADATVRAPFKGLVAERFVSVGEFVQPGTKLFELVSLHPIEVEFRLAEIDSSRVEVGQRVAVRVAPYPDEVFEAHVTVISPTIDVRTRTLRVKAALENLEGRLRPGLFARADLGVSRRSGALMVPEEAILQRSDGSVVFRMVGQDRVQRRVVETGVYHKGLVEVLSGLDAQDHVVTRGHTSLVEGSTVLVRNIDGSPALSPDVATGPGSSSLD